MNGHRAMFASRPLSSITDIRLMGWHVYIVPILLQKSARSSWRAIIESGRATFLNQHCALVPDLESILLAQVLKFFLQQYRPKADIAASAILLEPVSRRGTITRNSRNWTPHTVL